MIVLGTSGYHFADWVGPFYPQQLDKRDWLGYYARHFRAVEINSSYYGLPKAASVARWNGETPDSFRFMVKLHGDTTHRREGRGEEIAELLEALGPIRRSGKLAGLLGQFPASFHAGPESEDYLGALKDRTEDVPLYVEFRHASWDTERAVELVERLGFGWVAVDLPPLRGLMNPRPAVTRPGAYVRFHGRNTATWYNPKAGDRYDWNYEARELKEWVVRLEALTKRSEMAYLFFNNCHAGQAIKSAMLMREILKDQLEVL